MAEDQKAVGFSNQRAEDLLGNEFACLASRDGRSLYRVQSATGCTLVEVLTCEGESQAEAVCAKRQTWRNRVSLHPGLMLAPLEVRRDGRHVLVHYEPCEGCLLPEYLHAFFGEYMAEEDFALELIFHLADGLRTLSHGPVRLEDVWLASDGRVRLLPSLEGDSERAVLLSLGEVLFEMLTRQKARGRPENVLGCRDVNGEISTSAEAAVRRCVQGVESGGFGSVASLRQSLHDLLRSRHPDRGLSGGVLHDFHRDKPHVAYAEALQTAVRTETRYLESLRRSTSTTLERMLGRLFGKPEKAGLRPLWVPFVGFYLLLIAPILMARLSPETTLIWMGILLLIYVGVFAAIRTSYRRTRE